MRTRRYSDGVIWLGIKAGTPLDKGIRDIPFAVGWGGKRNGDRMLYLVCVVAQTFIQVMLQTAQHWNTIMS
jgi:hypothetical protein